MSNRITCLMHLPSCHHYVLKSLMETLKSSHVGILDDSFPLRPKQDARAVPKTQILFASHQLVLIGGLASPSRGSEVITAPGITQYSIVPILCHLHVYTTDHILPTSPKSLSSPLLGTFLPPGSGPDSSK